MDKLKENDIKEPDLANLETRFKGYSPRADQVARYSDVQKLGLFVSEQLLRLVPESRERSLAITKVEEAIMWANAAIDRNQS